MSKEDIVSKFDFQIVREVPLRVVEYKSGHVSVLGTENLTREELVRVANLLSHEAKCRKSEIDKTTKQLEGI